MKLNIELLERIKKHIKEEPRRLYMSWFVEKGKPGAKFEGDNLTIQEFAECGTAACIFGWANILTGAEAHDYRHAVDELGLAPGGESLSSPYAYVSDVPHWPEPFRSQYKKAQTAKVRANVAVARIDHLIQTGN